MQDEVKKYLLDISKAISHITEFTKTTSGYQNYCANLQLKRAVERELEIIGEALAKATRLDNSLPITNAKKL